MITLDSLVKKLSEDIEKGKVVSYSVTDLEDNTIYEDYRYLPYNIKKKLEKLLPVTLGDVKDFLSVSHVKNYLVLVDIEKEEKLAAVIVFHYPSQKEAYKEYMKLLTGEDAEIEQEKVLSTKDFSEISNLVDALRDVTKDAVSTKQKVDAIKGEINAIKGEIKELSKQAKQNTSSIDELYNKYSSIATTIVNLQSMIEEISKTVTKTKNGVEKIKTKISKLEKLLSN